MMSAIDDAGAQRLPELKQAAALCNPSVSSKSSSEGREKKTRSKLALLIARPLTGFAICPAIRGIIAEIKVGVRPHACVQRPAQLRGFQLVTFLQSDYLPVGGGRARTAVTAVLTKFAPFLVAVTFLFANVRATALCYFALRLSEMWGNWHGGCFFCTDFYLIVPALFSQ